MRSFTLCQTYTQLKAGESTVQTPAFNGFSLFFFYFSMVHCRHHGKKRHQTCTLSRFLEWFCVEKLYEDVVRVLYNIYLEHACLIDRQSELWF